jgi:plastocyanin
MRKKLNKIKINVLILVSTVAPILFLSGCTQQQTNHGVNTISMENFAFNPSTLTVSNGTTVTWINNDNVDHTVTAEGGLFDSGTLTKGENFTYTFTEPGTYSYSCSIHPSMKGTIIVQQTSI